MGQTGYGNSGWNKHMVATRACGGGGGGGGVRGEDITQFSSK